MSMYAYVKAINGPLDSSEKTTVRIEVSKLHKEEYSDKTEWWEEGESSISVSNNGKASFECVGILPGIKDYKLTFYDKTTGEYLGDREMQFVDH